MYVDILDGEPDDMSLLIGRHGQTLDAIQVGQQTILLRAGHIGPEAVERRIAEHREQMAKGGPQKKGIMAWINEKASAAQQQQEQVREKPQGPRPKPKPTNNQRRNANAKGGKPAKDGRPADGTPAKGAPNDGKPVKGAQPGNRLKPKKKS